MARLACVHPSGGSVTAARPAAAAVLLHESALPLAKLALPLLPPAGESHAECRECCQERLGASPLAPSFMYVEPGGTNRACWVLTCVGGRAAEGRLKKWAAGAGCCIRGMGN